LCCIITLQMLQRATPSIFIRISWLQD
jgi:hypothetical protein